MFKGRTDEQTAVAFASAIDTRVTTNDQDHGYLDLMSSNRVNSGRSTPELVTERISQIKDWRGDTLARIRALIRAADPEVVEEVKWRKPSNPAGVPVWSHAGLICSGEVYKDKVKVTFARGAALDDPAGLFNASLAGNTRRAIDIHESLQIDEAAFQTLIRSAVALNLSKAQR